MAFKTWCRQSSFVGMGENSPSRLDGGTFRQNKWRSRLTAGGLECRVPNVGSLDSVVLSAFSVAVLFSRGSLDVGSAAIFDREVNMSRRSEAEPR